VLYTTSSKTYVLLPKLFVGKLYSEFTYSHSVLREADLTYSAVEKMNNHIKNMAQASNSDCPYIVLKLNYI